MKNHGHLTVGESVDEALWWYVTFERSRQAQLMAEAAGTTQPIPTIWRFHSGTGRQHVGRLVQQPLFDVILSEQPELLD